jgi:hypothetical protein
MDPLYHYGGDLDTLEIDLLVNNLQDELNAGVQGFGVMAVGERLT